MLRETVPVINKLGLHARAALQVIHLAGRFESEIQLQYQNKMVNAKSIMNVMALSVSQGNEVEIIVTGPDENEAMQQMKALFADRFGEPE